MTPPPDLPARLEHFIGGAHAASADGATFELADPVSNRPYATAAAGGPKDVDRAVAAAQRAFAGTPWPALPGRARARILNKIADGIEARAERIAALETFDTGLPVTPRDPVLVHRSRPRARPRRSPPPRPAREAARRGHRRRRRLHPLNVVGTELKLDCLVL